MTHHKTTTGIPSGEERGVVMVKVMSATTALTLPLPLPLPLMEASVVSLIAVIIILGSHFLTKSFMPGKILTASFFNPH